MNKQKGAAPFKTQPRECGALPSNFNANVQMFLIICNTDTGQLISAEVTTPIEYVPFGFYVLHFIGTKCQVDKLIHKYRRNPSLLDKFTDR